MTRHRRQLPAIFSGTLIAFIDFYALVGQQQFVQLQMEKLRQPAFANLMMVPAGPTGTQAKDDILLTVSVDANGRLHMNDEAEALTLATLGDRLRPLAHKAGTVYLYGDPGTDWGLMLQVQRAMQTILGRQILTPIVMQKEVTE